MVRTLRAYTDHEARDIARHSFAQACRWAPEGCTWPPVADLPPALQSRSNFVALHQLAHFLDGGGG